MTAPLRRRIVAAALAAGTLAACGSTKPPKPPAPPLRRPLWPPPPEQPRFIFEATLRNSASLGDETSTTQMRRLLVGEDTGQSFGKPFAVAAARGRVYVTDTEGRRVFVFDIPRRRTYAFGVRLEGALKKPSGIAVDQKGRVYVVDTTARRVVIYDELGLYLGEIEGSALWTRPTAVAVDDAGERVYVVDTAGVESERHRITVHDARGAMVGEIGRRGGRPGEFNLPADAGVAADGTLWVLDAGNFRVQAFDAQGGFVRQFGSPGNGLGQLARPRGLAVGRDGLVYVSDAMLCNVQVFQPDGQLLLALGARAGDRDAPGRYLLPARLAADETGRLYVVDQFLHKVEVLRRLSDEEGLRWMAQPPP